MRLIRPIWSPEKQDIQKYEDEYVQQQYYSSLFAGKLLAAVLTVLISIFIIFVLTPNNQFLSVQSNIGYTWRSYLYGALIATQVLVLFLLQLRRIDSPKQITAFHRTIIDIDTIWLLIWSACMTGIDQLIHGDIAVYLIACFIVATAVQFNPGKS